jgi:hypothetical protein
MTCDEDMTNLDRRVFINQNHLLLIMHGGGFVDGSLEGVDNTSCTPSW